MCPSVKFGSSSPALDVQVPRSPSLPGSGTPLWDNMSLPSSPSPKAHVPDSNMDLDRYAKRGFSEDLALPPRQIEKPFRFLDLSAEIRNMVYEFTFDRAFVSPCYGWNSAIKVLADFLEFAEINGAQIKSITVRRVCSCHRPTQSFTRLVSSARFLAPLRKSLDLTGKVHPAVREFKFADETSLAHRIFDFAGSLESSELKIKKVFDSKLRVFLHADPEGSGMMRVIEMNELLDKQKARRQKKEDTRRQNQATGLERWGSVLRSRSTSDAV
ncbi:hypothetical protein QM012_000397 [Aureobasidium pullulans]|uniref:Uncharacterized protein n=1 Tax=Aureobasidium pullulans TaxID=5580 RepID=A0ABR0TVJ3_AURPU